LTRTEFAIVRIGLKSHALYHFSIVEGRIAPRPGDPTKLATQADYGQGVARGAAATPERTGKGEPSSGNEPITVLKSHCC